MSDPAERGPWGDAADAVKVDAAAIVHGGELVGPASLSLLPDRVMLVAAGEAGPRSTGRLSVIELPYATLDGARIHDRGLTLYLGDGDVVELAPLDDGELPVLARTGAELVARASRLPELTMSLRALGSRGAGAEHDEFFGPLLRARAAAERADDPVARVSAVDAPVLRARLDDAVRAAAARRSPASPPDRRALEAELGECVSPLAEALDALAARAEAVRSAADDARLARWREWAAALARVFARADGCWEASLPALAQHPRTSRRRSLASRLWRSVRGD